MNLRLKTGPAVEPLSLAEAKLHLRVDDDLTDDDGYITALIVAVREYCENFQHRAFITQTWTLALDDFYWTGRSIQIPRPPLKSISSIKYLGRTELLDSSMDSAYDGATGYHTMNPALYQVDIQSEPGRIAPIPSSFWPYTRLSLLSPSLNNVLIEFIAGYGDAAASVPARVKAAMRLMIGHLYENRESTLTGARAVAIDVPGFEELLWGDRLVGFP